MTAKALQALREHPRILRRLVLKSRKIPVGCKTPCMEWAGTRNNSGYGKIKWEGRMEYVHRIIFHVVRGYDPIIVRHKCDNPPCGNPEHHLPGNHSSNLRDQYRRGRR